MFITADELCRAAGWKLLSGSPSVFVGGNRPGGISIDSRTLSTGDWFLPLIGKTGIDGHTYVEAAVKAGAGGCILSNVSIYENKIRKNNPHLPVILVPDTNQALADIARILLNKFSPFVVAITGSVGKTSVKENIAHVASSRWQTLKSPHNWNTEIGLPLTVFNLTQEHKVAVLECAARGAGQIRHLTLIAKPDIAVITSIGPSHLSEFGSIDNIARAKWEIVEGLQPNGIVVAPKESPYTDIYGSDYKVVTFGMTDSADVHPVEIRQSETETEIKVSTPRGEFTATIPGTTDAHIINTLCTIAACEQISIPEIKGKSSLSINEIAVALRNLPDISGRFELITRPTGVDVIFDAYNSNPLSLANALEAFCRKTRLSNGSPIKRRVAVIGDMLELGQQEGLYHYEAGAQIGNLPIDCILTVGKLSEVIRKSAEETRNQSIDGAHYPNAESLAADFHRWIKRGDLVLMKASRAIALEKLLEGEW